MWNLGGGTAVAEKGEGGGQGRHGLHVNAPENRQIPQPGTPVIHLAATFLLSSSTDDAVVAGSPEHSSHHVYVTHPQ